MHHKYCIFFMVLLYLLYPPTQNNEQNNPVGKYSMTINVRNYDYKTNIATSDAEMLVSLSPGNEFVYIPLPFQESPDEKVIVEPNSDDNLVLFGHMRPVSRFSTIQISLLNRPTQLRISIQGMYLPLELSTHSSSNRTLLLLFREAERELSGLVSDYRKPQLTDLVVNAPNIQGSTPPRRADIFPEYSIALSESGDEPGNITVFLAQEQRIGILYLILGGLGILIGSLGAPRFVKSRRSAIVVLIIGFLGLIGMVFVVFVLLTPEQRINDTTTVVTIGTVVGVFLSFIGIPLYYLYSLSRPTTPSQTR